MIALALAVVLVVLIVAFAQLLRAQQRANARREDLLLNQLLLHAVGKPWQAAPANERTPEPEPGERWTSSPEQYPHV